MKVYAALAYTLVFWVLALSVQHYQAGLLPSQSNSKNNNGINPPFWDNFGLSCISNVLIGSLYLIIYMGDIAFRKVYCANKKKMCHNNMNSTTTTNTHVTNVNTTTTTTSNIGNDSNGIIFCVEDEEEEHSNNRQNVEQVSQQNNSSTSSTSINIELPKKEDEELDSIVLRVTPGLLWYYMYTTGWGVFCIAYTLHGAHWISSLCLCSGSLFCSIWGALRGRYVNNSNKRTVMCFLMIFNLISVCMCTSFICGHQRLLWRSWVVEIACPFMAPFWLLESKEKMIPMNMPKHSIVLFGLPFTSMISAGYLSMYIPLQECANGQIINDEILNHTSTVITSMIMNHTNNTSIIKEAMKNWTPLITEKNILGQSFWGILLSGFIVPGLMYLSFVFYVSSFQKIDTQLVCANSLWLVLTARICSQQREEDILGLGELRNTTGGFETITFMALLGWFASLLFVLLHHFEHDTIREWRNVYGDILLIEDCDTIEPVSNGRQ
jgi:hypothetical protein